MRLCLLTLALCFASSLAVQAEDKKKEDAKSADKKDDKKKDDKKKDDKKPAAAAGFDYPLKVGSTWTYRVGENRYEVKISKIEPVGAAKCARLDMIINGKAASYEDVAIGTDKDGVSAVMRYTFEGKKATPPIPFLLLPADKTSWRVESKIDGQTLKGTFRKTTEDVKVPAGTYPKAVKVSSDNLKVNGADLAVTWWFASGVGLIKQEADLAGQRVVIELEKYEAGK